MFRTVPAAALAPLVGRNCLIAQPVKMPAASMMGADLRGSIVSRRVRRLVPVERKREVGSRLCTRRPRRQGASLIRAPAETPRASVEKFMQNFIRAGFAKTAPDLSKLFETP